MTARQPDIQASIADDGGDFSAFHKDQPKSLGEWDSYRDRSDRLREQSEARKRARARGEL